MLISVFNVILRLQIIFMAQFDRYSIDHFVFNRSTIRLRLSSLSWYESEEQHHILTEPGGGGWSK